MSQPAAQPHPEAEAHPWPALWALVIGFFMILVDSTIVSVGTNALMKGLDADLGQVLWVTSGYLLAYAVPLLITGRLGDRFGPRRVYLIGLALFTLSSLACGLSPTITVLILARVAQGLGAALMTPQTMAVITRLFPPAQRGNAMAIWGATAGVATLVGPILGGVLIDALGWEWIFFINVPIGVLGFLLVLRNVPVLETHGHSFDWLGVVLSAVGLFCIVFGIEEGRSYDWGTITGPITVWRLIAVGAAIMAVFVWWQTKNRKEPLVPPSLFRDRNFTVANTSISTMGFAVTAQSFPFMIWAQTVRGWTPTQAALLLIPMAVLSLVLAKPVGDLVNTVHPRVLAAFGLVVFGIGLVALGASMSPTVPIWQIEVCIALLGLGSAFVWAPLSTSATANLRGRDAGAGAGVYNTTRQIGSVLGSAAIAVLMQSRIAAHLPSGASAGAGDVTGAALPDALEAGFSTALGESLYLPAGVILVGALVSLLLERPAHNTGGRARHRAER